MAGFWLFSSDGLPGRDACAVIAVGSARGSACVCVHVDGCGCACSSVGSGAGRVRADAGVLCSCLCPFAGACGLGCFSDYVAVWRVSMLHGCLAGAPVVDLAGSCVGVSAGCSSVGSGVFSVVSCNGVVFSYGACGSFASFGVFSVAVGFCGHCLPCVCSDGCGCSCGAAGVSACLVVCVLVLVCVSAPVLVIGRAYGCVPVCVWSVVLQAWLVSVSLSGSLSVSVAGCWIMAVVPVSALACFVSLMRGCWCGWFGLSLRMYWLVSGAAMFMFMAVVVAVSYMVMLALSVPVCALAGVYMRMADVPAGLGMGLLRLVAFSRGGLCGGLPVEGGASAVVSSPVLCSPADPGGGSGVMAVLLADMGAGADGWMRMSVGVDVDVDADGNGYAGCGDAVAAAPSDHGSVPLWMGPVLTDVLMRVAVCTLMLFGWIPLLARLLRRLREDEDTDADMRMDMGVVVVANMETSSKDEGIAAGAEAYTCEQAVTADADGISEAAGACSDFHDSIRFHASTCAPSWARMMMQGVDTRMTDPEGGR